jgi:hypothetical protein
MRGETVGTERRAGQRQDVVTPPRERMLIDVDVPSPATGRLHHLLRSLPLAQLGKLVDDGLRLSSLES